MPREKMEKNLANAIDAVRSGVLSPHKAGKVYGIQRKTLHARISKKGKHCQTIEDYISVLRWKEKRELMEKKKSSVPEYAQNFSSDEELSLSDWKIKQDLLDRSTNEDTNDSQTPSSDDELSLIQWKKKQDALAKKEFFDQNKNTQIVGVNNKLILVNDEHTRQNNQALVIPRGLLVQYDNLIILNELKVHRDRQMLFINKHEVFSNNNQIIQINEPVCENQQANVENQEMNNKDEQILLVYNELNNNDEQQLDINKESTNGDKGFVVEEFVDDHSFDVNQALIEDDQTLDVRKEVLVRDEDLSVMQEEIIDDNDQANSDINEELPNQKEIGQNVEGDPLPGCSYAANTDEEFEEAKEDILDAKIDREMEASEIIKLHQNSWYCHACKDVKEYDMRRCSKCPKWYHEICVGLTPDDDDYFQCPCGC